MNVRVFVGVYVRACTGVVGAMSVTICSPRVLSIYNSGVEVRGRVGELSAGAVSPMAARQVDGWLPKTGESTRSRQWRWWW